MGWISPNFARQAKTRWCTAFGKKIAVQFHQHTLSMKLPNMYYEIHQINLMLAKRHLPKKLIILFAQKSCVKYW